MKARRANKGCMEGLDTDPPLQRGQELVPCRYGKWNLHTVLFGKGFVLRVEGLSEDVLSPEGILFKILLPQTPLKLV